MPTDCSKDWLMPELMPRTVIAEEIPVWFIEKFGT